MEFVNRMLGLRSSTSDRVDETKADSSGSDFGRRCIGCDTTLTSSSSFTAEWEDGDNEGAYVTCTSCGCQNPF